MDIGIVIIIVCGMIMLCGALAIVLVTLLSGQSEVEKYNPDEHTTI